MTTQYEEEFPKHLGPPRVENHTGPKILRATKPVYAVELDSGAFRALWESMEGHAKYDLFPNGDTSTATTFARAYLRALAAFRTTYWSVNEPPPAPAPPRKRLTRKR